MEAKTHLDSVEFRISHAQIGVRNVRPSAANLSNPPAVCEYLNSAATPRGEVEVRGISRREVGVRAQAAPSQLDVWGDASDMQAGVPPQNDWLKAAAIDCLSPQLPKYWDYVDSVLEAALPPTAADFARQLFAQENSNGQSLRFRKGVGVLFASRPSHPDVEVPIAVLCIGKATLRIDGTNKK